MTRRSSPDAHRGRQSPSASAPAARASISRGVVFGALSGVALLAAVGYLAFANQRNQTQMTAMSADLSADPQVISEVVAQPHVVFLHSTGGDQYRRVAVAPLDGLEPQRFLTPLQCQRLYVAADEGLCLGNNYIGGIMTPYNAYTFDTNFESGHTFQAAGIPSRVRLAPDGKHGTMTAFVSGHSYAQGSFSTQTTIVDMDKGETIADLEQFTVLRDGAKIESPDFNFWGVTFMHDGNRFFATLGTEGKTYLLEGDLAARQLRVLRENVECPSLSPDNTQLIFKKRVSDTDRLWQLHLLDLATMQERPLPGESRNVDDQVEWLDNGHVLYALPDEGPPATIATNIWVAPIDGREAPQIFLRNASSPAVVK